MESKNDNEGLSLNKMGSFGPLILTLYFIIIIIKFIIKHCAFFFSQSCHNQKPLNSCYPTPEKK